MVTDLPKYMTDVLKYNIKTAGMLSAMPYVAMWIAAFFFGLFCDFCTKRQYFSILTARKLFTTIGELKIFIKLYYISYKTTPVNIYLYFAYYFFHNSIFTIIGL